MQSEWLWWLPGAALIASPGWWFAWRAHLNRELENFRKVTSQQATYYASRHVGPRVLEAVGRQLGFDRRPPRPTLRGFGRRRLRRALEQSQGRRGLKGRRVQNYLMVTVLPQLPGLFAVSVEPAAGTSAWHALEEMARAKAWSVDAGGPPPTWFEPTLDGTGVPYYFFRHDDVLVYVFADPGWFDRLWMRGVAICRRLRRLGGRLPVGARAFRRALRRVGRRRHKAKKT